jgi:hypothetical protein
LKSIKRRKMGSWWGIFLLLVGMLGILGTAGLFGGNPAPQPPPAAVAAPSSLAVGPVGVPSPYSNRGISIDPQNSWIDWAPSPWGWDEQPYIRSSVQNAPQVIFHGGAYGEFVVTDRNGPRLTVLDTIAGHYPIWYQATRPPAYQEMILLPGTRLNTPWQAADIQAGTRFHLSFGTPIGREIYILKANIR